jgi:hypothetical protein
VTISEELSYAILSLDAYNRGYAPGIAVEGNSLGRYTILLDSEEAFRLPGQDPNAFSPAGDASFYAAAYEDASGNIVISYRGTDDPTLGADLAAWMGGAGHSMGQDGQAECQDSAVRCCAPYRRLQGLR